MKTLLLSVISILFISIAGRNFIRLQDKLNPIAAIEKSVSSILARLPEQRTIAYYSNTVQDGLYFNAQFAATPHVLVKFGHQDTAIFVMDLTKKDTLFRPHRLPYRLVDSIQFGHIKSYLLVRKP
jgi:hypothetical protein